jgi:hypothetical protein
MSLAPATLEIEKKLSRDSFLTSFNFKKAKGLKHEITAINNLGA